MGLIPLHRLPNKEEAVNGLVQCLEFHRLTILLFGYPKGVGSLC